MDDLLKEVRRVQRRLAVQHFLGVLGWCWFASLLAAASVIGAARFYPLRIVDWQWLAGFLVAGLIGALAWTVLTLTPALKTAMEIDHRFRLKERISSTLAMAPADRETEAGQALIADTEKRVRRIAVCEKFPVRPSRCLLLPLLPALLVVVTVFRPPMKEKQADATETAATSLILQVKKSADDLRQKLAERRKQAEKEGLKDATELLKRLEEGTKGLEKQTDREKALVKLNDLARELRERQKQLGSGGDALKRQMEKVEDISKGPADDLKKAMSRGDFEKAAQALEKLQKQLANNQLDAAKKEDLAKQLDQLKQKLDQMAKQAEEVKTDLENRAKQIKQAGDPAANKLEEEIQKLKQQGPQMQALQSLANKLGQCAQQMQQGQNGQAAQAMQDALQQMQDLARQQAELESLEGALEQLGDARRQMNCDHCGGEGCEFCQGGGAGDKKDGKPGPNLGQGPGDGARPEAKTDAGFYNSRVRQTIGKGAAQVTGLTDGPNLKNQAEADVQKATAEIEHGRTDPLSGQRLPKRQSEHARQYFDSFREGK
jgi:hypothetical protein